jgi:hypothetical protein
MATKGVLVHSRQQRVSWSGHGVKWIAELDFEACYLAPDLQR